MDASSNAVYASPSADLGQVQEEHHDKGFFSFSGRIGRLRYLAYGVALLLIPGFIAVQLALAIGVENLGFGETGFSFAPALVPLILLYLAIVMYGFVFAVRRLNDIGWTGWLSIILIIPYVGALFSLLLMLIPGSDGANKYGSPAGPNTLGVKLLALFLPAIAIIGIIAAIALPAYQDYVERAQQSQQ